jgi:hypothetical protein
MSPVSLFSNTIAISFSIPEEIGIGKCLALDLGPG